MAKTKKNIGAFQEAMLSNTKMIAGEAKETEKKAVQTSKRPPSKSSTEGTKGISPDLYNKVLAFGEKHHIDPETVISKSLDLFLSLEDYWFDTKSN
jgi:hypothetical protein